jgi:hypothetical protein
MIGWLINLFSHLLTKIKYSNVGIYVQWVPKFDNVSKIAWISRQYTQTIIMRGFKHEIFSDGYNNKDTI